MRQGQEAQRGLHVATALLQDEEAPPPVVVVVSPLGGVLSPLRLERGLRHLLHGEGGHLGNGRDETEMKGYTEGRKDKGGWERIRIYRSRKEE